MILLPLPFLSSIFSVLAQSFPLPSYFLLQIFLSIFSAPPSWTHLIFVPACFLQLWGPRCPVLLCVGCLCCCFFLCCSALAGDSLISFMLDLVFYSPNSSFQWEPLFLPRPVNVKCKEESSRPVAVKCGDLQI